MAYADLRATVWSTLGFTYAYSVANIARVMNRNHENREVNKPFEVLRIPRFNPGDLTVRTTWTATTSDSDYGDYVDVTVDETPSLSYEYPDLDPLQIPVDVAAEVVKGMGLRLGREMDVHCIETISGSNAGPVTVSGLDHLYDARKTLADSGYNEGEIWYFASPAQYLNLMKDDDFQKAATDRRGDFVESGVIKTAGGVNIVEQSVDTNAGVMFNTAAVGFLLKKGIDFKLADMFGGTAKFGTRIGAKALYKAFVLDSNGCLFVTNGP